jgi:hypothetical protein
MKRGHVKSAPAIGAAMVEDARVGAAAVAAVTAAVVAAVAAVATRSRF